MNIQISVTAEDIAQGSHNDPTACMCQRAISRALPGHMVTVGIDQAHVGKWWLPLPAGVEDRIRAGISHQQGRKILRKVLRRRFFGLVRTYVNEYAVPALPEPFTFTLDVPEELLAPAMHDETAGVRA